MPTAELAARAPTMAGFATEPLVLPGVRILTVNHESVAATNEAVLPPGLHPTIPPIVSWTVWECDDGPLGRFTLAQTRVTCRSGMRPRTFLVSDVVDGADAATALTDGWGFSCRPGRITVDRRYDHVRATVELDGRCVLDIDAVDPVPLRPSDIQWIAAMHPAHTPRGLRLVQCDPDFDVQRAERARPALARFDAAAWGEPRLDPRHPVVATLAHATITLPRVRYLCSVEELAFVGTEVIEAESAS